MKNQPGLELWPFNPPLSHCFLQRTPILTLYISHNLAERLQRKRVGTLENVISDLKRFRDMDNKESTDTDKNAIPPETRAAANEEQTEPQEHGLEQ